MEKMYIVSFNSTHHAIRSEKIMEENGLIRTLPTPREIAASCGISIKFEYDKLEEVKKILKDNGIEYRGLFCINKYEDGKREAQEI